MALLVAHNLVDRIVLLEDGRELPITQFYASNTPGHRLTAKSELRKEHHVDNWEDAEVYTVDVPGADAALIFELAAITEARAKDIN